MLLDKNDVCGMPLDVCFTFGRTAQSLIERGIARKLATDEASAIMGQAEEAGLVHFSSNTQEIGFICNCCACHCGILEGVLKHQESLTSSSYRVRNDPATCRACELCVERYPIGALHMEASPQAANRKGQAPVLNPESCIGCGVCAYKCPTESLALERRAMHTEPPKDARDYARQVVAFFRAGHARKKAAASG